MSFYYFANCSFSFADEQIRLPEISIFGKDLSIYGISPLKLEISPDKDKEKFIVFDIKKQPFPEQVASGRKMRALFSAGEHGFLQSLFSFRSISGRWDTGLLAEGSGRYLGNSRKQDKIFRLAGFYNKPDVRLKILPYLFRRQYENLSAGPGAATFFELPAYFSKSYGGFFSQVFVSAQAAREKNPVSFYGSPGEAKFFSFGLGSRGSARWRDFFFRLNIEFSRQNWDWVLDEKDFFSFRAKVSGEKKLGNLEIYPRVEASSRAGENVLLAAASAACFLKNEFVISGGINPEILQPSIEEVVSQKAAILKTFPFLARSNYKNLFLKISKRFENADFSFSFAHRETRNYFYLDESGLTFGELKTAFFKRNEVAFTAGVSGDFCEIEFREKYRIFSDFPSQFRNSAVLSAKMKIGATSADFVLDSVSGNAFRGSFVAAALKICYNLSRDFNFFFGVDNLFGNKIYYSRYDVVGDRIFSAGAEIAFGEKEARSDE
ncbi:MAG: hypothetical protein J7L54_02955 [Elusimicrobia bacterium]|nr:hypothetical protein [Elusimicrobiota bacterium]